MAVASFDQNVAFMQNVLATQGESTANALKRERDQGLSNQSDKKREVDDEALRRMSQRDKIRAKSDPTFKPQDSDFNAPRTMEFYTNVDYYQALGVDQYATNEEIKKAYRKLSLTYHPDKTNGMDQEQKEEYAAIFIELKSAYKLLSDNPTRRQYDFHRDRNDAREKLYGKKTKDAPSFNAHDALRKLEKLAAEHARKPGEVKEVVVSCKLEKIVHGGHKRVKHERRIRDRANHMFTSSTRLFRLDVPPGAMPPHPVTFKGAGDHYEDRRPDDLQFMVTPRKHDIVDLDGQDLKVRAPIDLGHNWSTRPVVMAEVPSVSGRHTFLLGKNPFAGAGAPSDSGELRVSLQGQGINKEGSLSFGLNLRTGGASSSKRGSLAAGPTRRHPSPTDFLESFGLGPPWGFQVRPKTDQSYSLPSQLPAMKRRTARGSTGKAVCSVRLEQVGRPVALYTKPACTLTFYSSLVQTSGAVSATPPVFAICLSCPTCGKKKAISHWNRLKQDLFPLLSRTAFLLLREAYGVSPKCLIGRAARQCASLPEGSWVEVAESDAESVSDGSDLEITVYIDREFDISSTFKLRRRRLVKELKKQIAAEAGADAADIMLKAGGFLLSDSERVTSKMTEIDVCDTSLELPPPKPPKPRRRVPRAKATKLLNPLKQLGDAAFKEGLYWHGVSLYSHALGELLEGSDEVPKVLSNRAACLAKLGDFAASLDDARKAVELAPGWGRAWSRIGLAAWKLGRDSLPEARDAYIKAVDLEPTGANVDALQGVVQLLQGVSVEVAHSSQEKGNQALRVKEFGLAVAEYTCGIACLPPPPTKSADGATPEDEHALLRAVLFMNRSMAFTWLRSWASAVADATRAVEAKPDFAKARCQLGVALLGNRDHEQAYMAFAQALHMDQNSRSAEKGRKACLLELQYWRSRASCTRLRKRLWLDWHKPRGSARVFAISDIHFQQRGVQEWVYAIDDFAFVDDSLIVAGNLAESLTAIVRGLTALKSKFRRVFYTVGNREMWLVDSEPARYPDSLAKLHAIFEACDKLDVDIVPAPVCEGVFVVPLLSWYTAEFDEKDPFPTMKADINKRCKWPVDADEQLWKYMLKLNQTYLERPFHGTIITFSHFLPRRGLPFDKDVKYMAKCIGCEDIDKQVRAADSKLHVFGHSGEKYASSHTGVKYVHMPLGKVEVAEAGTEKDQQGTQPQSPPLLLVYNGKHLCMQEWAINGSCANRVQLVSALAMPNFVDESEEHKELRKVIRKINDLPGVKGYFHSNGTRKQDRAALTRNAWPDLEKLSQRTTHGFHVVADNVSILKEFLHGDVFKEWRKKTEPRTEVSISLFAPLGLDLEPYDPVTQKAKEDTMLAVYFLTLKDSVTEDSQEYGKIQSAVVDINRLPGAAGRIAAAIQPVGFPPFSSKELLAKVQWRDASWGCTHLFLVAVDSPASFKLLIGSKTFAKWGTAVKAHLAPGSQMPQLAFAMPLGVTATALAPHAVSVDVGARDRQ